MERGNSVALDDGNERSQVWWIDGKEYYKDDVHEIALGIGMRSRVLTHFALDNQDTLKLYLKYPGFVEMVHSELIPVEVEGTFR